MERAHPFHDSGAACLYRRNVRVNGSWQSSRIFIDKPTLCYDDIGGSLGTSNVLCDSRMKGEEFGELGGSLFFFLFVSLFGEKVRVMQGLFYIVINRRWVFMHSKEMHKKCVRYEKSRNVENVRSKIYCRVQRVKINLYESTKG